MKGDFSRVTFDPRKNFTRVLMQQGRVQLDADWNEQSAILLHYLRTLAADMIGPFGGPKEGLGFAIAKVTEANGRLADLTIEPGHYYVGGLLCENPGNAEGKPIEYSKQRDYAEPAELPTELPFLVYLDVWERHITWVQDDAIREVALGRLDTATRAQLVWQVRAVREAPGVGIVGETRDAVIGQWQKWVSFWQPPNRGKLKARARMEGDDTNPCIASPEARYRGAENQLYRVEIQAYEEGGPAATKAVTFKWSRENGSVIFPIRTLRGMTAQLGSLGRDEATGLKRGDWVELVDDVIDLSGRPGPLLRVADIDAARATVTLEKAAGDNVNLPDYDEQDEATRKHAFLRRWDHQESSYKKKEDTRLPKGGVLFVFGEAGDGDGWISLEKGVQVQFQPEGTYRPGDYWLIPARTATGDVEWPGTVKEPEAVPPHGVEHHFAPLALVTAGATPVVDLRRSFEGMAQ
ncbi:MAG TPA: DUF6519 domain-containing protein [Thermoanaerobaculia bacterium]|jgi:hypothetical protein|nr:DUF6519 domain-containing protein [Thermoanaerobaculia bacterium]